MGRLGALAGMIGEEMLEPLLGGREVAKADRAGEAVERARGRGRRRERDPASAMAISTPASRRTAR